METRIAQFEKVSKEQFFKDMMDTFGVKYGVPGDGLLSEIYERIKLPQRATTGSAGYDIFTPVHIILEPGKTIKIPTGIRCRIEPGWFLGVLPRSGHGFKYGVRLSNTFGIIYSDYFLSNNEGHIYIKLINDSCICKTVDIPTWQGMAQGIFLPFGITVDDECDGMRNGGFGSTDKPEYYI